MADQARLSTSAHENHGWRIDEITEDFTLLDAWALPASGRLEDFADLCEIVVRLGPSDEPGSWLSSQLFAIRMRLGEWFGWDKSKNTLPIPGCTESSLYERLPDDLKDSRPAFDDDDMFRPIFRTDREMASETSNSTVHAVMHVGWVDQGDGTYRGQMGVYAKTRSRFGATYMTMIAPFRHWIVYPALMRSIGRQWDSRSHLP
jgi:Protein of unknown function (DUF2867)